MGQSKDLAAANNGDQESGTRRSSEDETSSRSDLSITATRRASEVEASAHRITSHMSGPDDLEAAQPAMTNVTSYREPGDEVYNRLSSTRKSIIVFVLSFCAFLSPISSTSILAATPEVAAEYGTNGSVINISNAGYMVFMAISPIIWGPISQVFGRRPVSRS